MEISQEEGEIRGSPPYALEELFLARRSQEFSFLWVIMGEADWEPITLTTGGGRLHTHLTGKSFAFLSTLQFNYFTT